jgi:DNA-binding transcriptional MerR regulator
MGVLVLGIFLAIGKWYPGSGAEQLDWKPTRSYEDEVELELQDVDQMLEAQNERRRKSGRAEITEEDMQAEVDAHRREMERRAAELRRERGEEETE